jgi:hypothetical protein
LAAQGLAFFAAQGLHLAAAHLALHFAAQGLHFALHLAAHGFSTRLAAHFAAQGFNALFAAQGFAIARLTRPPPEIAAPATPKANITAAGITVEDNILPLNSITISFGK